jgi:hypothetical protein
MLGVASVDAPSTARISPVFCVVTDFRQFSIVCAEFLVRTTADTSELSIEFIFEVVNDYPDPIGSPLRVLITRLMLVIIFLTYDDVIRVLSTVKPFRRQELLAVPESADLRKFFSIMTELRSGLYPLCQATLKRIFDHPSDLVLLHLGRPKKRSSSISPLPRISASSWWIALDTR